MNYTIKTWDTGLNAWPHAALIGWDASSTLLSGWGKLRDEVNHWLIMNRVRNQYQNGLLWYFKTPEDVTLFVLRWS